MKMYIWNDPWKVSYGSSEMVVVAKNLEEARKLALTAVDGRWAYKGQTGIDLSNREPDKVIALPCAISFEWSE